MLKVSTVPVKSYLAPSKIPGVDFVINPYVGCPHKCLYCYAEYMRKFSSHTEPWGHFLDVKMCSAPLPVAKIFRRNILLSSVTDPYNVFEKRYEITRRLLRELVAAEAHIRVITKSSLAVRDIDLFRAAKNCEVTFSFSTVDESLRAQLEPYASPVEERIDALRQVHAAGIKTAVMAAPLLPELSDWKAIITATAGAADAYRFDGLNLKTPCQKRVMDFIDAHYPHLLPLYGQIYMQGDNTYYRNLAHEIRTYCDAGAIAADIFF